MNRPFNKSKYKELLKGLEAVELTAEEFKSDNFDLRLDAEYFSKINLNYLNQLEEFGYKEIGDFAYVTDGIHTSIDYSTKSNINLISATSPRENYFDLSRQVFISEVEHNNNPRTALNENDIVISTVGTIGNCAVVTKTILPANTDRHVGIIRCNELFFPKFVSTFLLTKYGRFQTWRESTGNVQLNLFVYRMKKIKIASSSLNFQERISELVSKAQYLLVESRDFYKTAEELLLKEIGLQNFEPSKEPVNIKSFSESFATSGRLDAEYYQKKYEQIVEKVINQNYDKLTNIVDIKKSIEPGSRYYATEGLPFMRVADFNKYGLTEPQKYLSERFVKENEKIIKSLKPKKRTILFSKDGSVGTAYHLREDFNGITSGAILHLTIKNETKIIPEYLTLVLNSQIVKMQSERDAGGSIILHWRVSQIENVVVPIIDFTKQKEIAQLIEDSFALKKESEHLLEVAKRAVEIAIEENEAAAMEHIANAPL